MVVIACDNWAFAFAKQVAAFIGEGSVTHDISAAEDAVHFFIIQRAKYCLKGVKISVDVGKYSDALIFTHICSLSRLVF